MIQSALIGIKKFYKRTWSTDNFLGISICLVISSVNDPVFGQIRIQGYVL